MSKKESNPPPGNAVKPAPPPGIAGVERLAELVDKQRDKARREMAEQNARLAGEGELWKHVHGTDMVSETIKIAQHRLTPGAIAMRMEEFNRQVAPLVAWRLGLQGRFTSLIMKPSGNIEYIYPAGIKQSMKMMDVCIAQTFELIMGEGVCWEGKEI